MKFEIFRCGTQFCWRLLGASNELISQGAKQRRSKGQVDEDILQLMDQVQHAEIHDKTQVNQPERTTNQKVRTPLAKTKKRVPA